MTAVEPWVVILLVLVAIIGVVVYIAAKSDPAPKPKPKPQRAPQRDVPVRRASPNINVQPGVTPIQIDPVPAEGGKGFIESGSPEDWAGDRVKARQIDIARSDFWIKPEATLFPPGKPCLLEAKIVDLQSNPLEGIPVVWKFREGNRAMNPLPVRTDANGVATFVYTVKVEDQSGDPNTPEPDSGSRLVICSAGGRILTRIRPLHDVA